MAASGWPRPSPMRTTRRRRHPRAPSRAGGPCRSCSRKRAPATRAPRWAPTPPAPPRPLRGRSRAPPAGRPRPPQGGGTRASRRPREPALTLPPLPPMRTPTPRRAARRPTRRPRPPTSLRPREGLGWPQPRRARARRCSARRPAGVGASRQSSGRRCRSQAYPGERPTRSATALSTQHCRSQRRRQGS